MNEIYDSGRKFYFYYLIGSYVDDDVNNPLLENVYDYIDDNFPWVDDYRPKWDEILETIYFPLAPIDRPCQAPYDDDLVLYPDEVFLTGVPAD